MRNFPIRNLRRSPIFGLFGVIGPQSAICNGFTLMELLVVIAIIGILAGILLPTLNKAREKAMRTVCIGNLKVIGEAFNMYNIDHGEMPTTITPAAPLNPYVATNQIQHTSPTYPVGLGYFYKGPSDTEGYIEDFAVFVCPASSYVSNAEIKQNWNATAPSLDVFSAYIYRAESGNSPGLMLSDSKPAIVLDYNNANPPATCTNCAGLNHQGEYVNILFRNGNVKGVENTDDTGASNKNGQLTLGGIDMGGGAVDIDELFRYAPGGVLSGGADNFQ